MWKLQWFLKPEDMVNLKHVQITHNVNILRITKKKAEPVMTDEVCPNCGSPVVIKKGTLGEFKACSNYPKCKTIIK